MWMFFIFYFPGVPVFLAFLWILAKKGTESEAVSDKKAKKKGLR